jgi:hypothetical protein
LNMGLEPMITVQPNRAPHRLKLLSRTFARRFTVRKTVASLSERPEGTSRCAEESSVYMRTRRQGAKGRAGAKKGGGCGDGVGSEVE